MASIRDCIAQVRAAGGNSARPSDAEAILQAVDNEAQRLMATRGLSDKEAHAIAASEMAARETGAAKLTRANELRNIAKRIDRNAQQQRAAEVLGKPDKPDLVEAIENQVTGKNTPGARRGGAQNDMRTIQYDLMRRVVLGLDNAKLFNRVIKNDPEFSRRWGIELAELSRQDAGRPANPGRTGDTQAQQVAQIIHEAQVLAKVRQNREGADIKDYADHITATSHNSDKIRRAGYQTWRDDFMRVLDQGRTFGSHTDVEEAMRNAFANIVSGHHQVENGRSIFDNPEHFGPSNLGKKVGASRSFHFLDPEGWLDYQEKYGTGTLLDQVVNNLNRAGRNIALLQRWVQPRARLAR